MKVLRYPARSLIGDYLRAASGLAVGVVVLASSPSNTVIVVIFGAIALLFGAFGLRTLQRNITQVALQAGHRLPRFSHAHNLLAGPGSLEVALLRHAPTLGPGPQ